MIVGVTMGCPAACSLWKQNCVGWCIFINFRLNI